MGVIKPATLDEKGLPMLQKTLVIVKPDGVLRGASR